MSTNRQKSFIAEMSTDIGHLDFPRLTHGKKVTYSYINPWTGSQETIDISNYLFAKKKKPKITLKFYFRCTGNHYHIYIRTPGAYYGRILGMNEDDVITATGDKDATNFNLLDNYGKVITLDDISSDKLTLQIQTTHGDLLTGQTFKKWSEGHYVTASGGGNMDFHLNIIERNASYLDDPDEV